MHDNLPSFQLLQGRLMCLGTPQHLKTRFGAAYAIELRCNTDQGDSTSGANQPNQPNHLTGGQALRQEYLVAELSATLPGLTVVSTSPVLARTHPVLARAWICMPR